MKTEIICVLDRSGSMGSIASETIGGFNSFIEEQKKVEGKARVTLVQFDNVYEMVYQGTKLKEVPVLDSNTFKPRGMTALYDAIGKTLTEQRKRIEADKWADKVIVVILTDGGENSSQEFNQKTVQQLTKDAQDSLWSFVYLGANQDSFDAAQSFGINTKSHLNMVSNYEANTAGAAFASRSYASTVTLMRTNTSSVAADVTLATGTETV